jgi:hypothetical protein
VLRGVAGNFPTTVGKTVHRIYGPPKLLYSYNGTKRQEREVHHSTPSSADVKNGGTIPPLHMSSWHSAQLTAHGNDCALKEFHSNLLGYYAKQSVESQRTFRKNICLHLPDSLLSLLFKHAGSMFLRNVG